MTMKEGSRAWRNPRANDPTTKMCPRKAQVTDKMEAETRDHLPSHSPAIPQRQPHGRAAKEDQCSTLVKYKMTGVKEMKIKLKKPKVETKCAASPKLALPRNILNRTWNEKKLFSHMFGDFGEAGELYWYM